MGETVRANALKKLKELYGNDKFYRAYDVDTLAENSLYAAEKDLVEEIAKLYPGEAPYADIFDAFENPIVSSVVGADGELKKPKEYSVSFTHRNTRDGQSYNYKLKIYSGEC